MNKEQIDKLELLDSEKGVLEEVYDMKNTIESALKSCLDSENDISPTGLLDAIKDFKDSLISRKSLGNGSEIFINKLEEVTKDVENAYIKIMEINIEKEDTGNKTSGSGAIGMIAFDAILSSDINENTSSGRF